MRFIDETILDPLSAKAAGVPRKRTHFNLHETLEDPFHRLFIAAEPGTYIRPHRHFSPPKWELFAIIRGSMILFEFDGDGRILQRQVLKAGATPCVVESRPETWHGFVVLESGTIGMEMKPGPYLPPSPGDVAAWAPAEGEPRTAELLDWLTTAEVGGQWRK